MEQHIDHYEEIVRIAGEAGALAALQAVERQRKRLDAEKGDRRLRNTKLLLKNYRMLTAHCEYAISEIKDVASEDPYDIIDMLDTSWIGEDAYVESIRRSTERTALMVRHIQEMLSLYRMYCEASGREEEERRYRTIDRMYIAEKRMSAREIAESECLDLRTVYKDIDLAVERLAALIFGIDGLRKKS